jgi:hypothetical protein
MVLDLLLPDGTTIKYFSLSPFQDIVNTSAAGEIMELLTPT